MVCFEGCLCVIITVQPHKLSDVDVDRQRIIMMVEVLLGAFKFQLTNWLTRELAASGSKYRCL
jgi:hypothetical protein